MSGPFQAVGSIVVGRASSQSFYHSATGREGVLAPGESMKNVVGAVRTTSMRLLVVESRDDVKVEGEEGRKSVGDWRQDGPQRVCKVNWVGTVWFSGDGKDGQGKRKEIWSSTARGGRVGGCGSDNRSDR